MNRYEIITPSAPELSQVAEQLHQSSAHFDGLGNEPLTAEDLAGVPEAPTLDVEPDLVRFTAGAYSFVYLRYVCHPARNNRLMLSKDQELLAKRMTWTYGRIAWRAGGGWPLYEVPCPPKRKPPSHKVMVRFGGKTFAPCSTPSSGVGAHMTSVHVLVHDDKYDDNTGLFEVIVTAYSRT